MIFFAMLGGVLGLGTIGLSVVGRLADFKSQNGQLKNNFEARFGGVSHRWVGYRLVRYGPVRMQRQGEAGLGWVRFGWARYGCFGAFAVLCCPVCPGGLWRGSVWFGCLGTVRLCVAS